MKKITSTLLGLVGFCSASFGQAVFSVAAPEYDGGSFSAFVAPAGTSTVAYHRACYLIPQSELSRMVLTNSVITSFGFDYFRAASSAVSGQFTVYLQNTTDATYNKGTTFSSILTGMSTNYNGNLVLPAFTQATQNSTNTVSMPLTNNFTWTGGGIYVAFDYYSAAPNATLFARYLTNATVSNGGANASAPSAGPAPATLSFDNQRPVMRFSAVNTATNEMGMTRLDAPGLVSKLMGAGHVITAQVRNNSAVTLNNVPVTLNISGANTFNNTQTITAIAAGATANVSFSPFNPTVNGANNMTVSLLADQVSANNAFGWTQTVTCSDYGNNPPTAAASFSDASYGFGGPAIIATRFVCPATCSLSGMKFAPSQAPQGSYSVCGVLLDAGGTIVDMTNTLSLSAASYGTYANFKFATPPQLSAGSSYYFGIAQLTGNLFPFGTSSVPADYNLNLYYPFNVAGGSPGAAQNFMGYLGIQGVISFSNTYIQAEASHTVLCNNKGVSANPETVLLTAYGVSGQTYNWAPQVSSTVTTSSVVVTPSLNAVQGLINYTVTATDVASGCKSNAAVITLSLQNCTGIPDNTGFGGSIVIFPNPAVNGHAVVKGLEGKNTITVFNVIGQSVSSFTTENEEAAIDLQNQPAGTYMVKITSSANQSRIIKVLKEN